MKLLKMVLLLSIFNYSYSQSLPDFKIVNLKGDTLTNEDLKGKNVYINIFESWCGSCVTEIPILNDTQSNFSDVVFIALTPAKRKKAKNFQQKHGFDLQIFPETEAICKQLKVNKFPTHFFLDKNGNLKEIKFNVSVTWKTNDYKKGKPPKPIFDKLVFEQNKSKLADALKLNLKSE